MKYRYKIVYPDKTTKEFDVPDESGMIGLRKMFSEITGIEWNDSNAAEVEAQKYSCKFVGPIGE